MPVNVLARVIPVRVLAKAWIGFRIAMLATAGELGDVTSTGGLPEITNAHAVHLLTPEAAARGRPVRLRAVVTFHNNHSEKNCFVQDNTDGLYVQRSRTSIDLRTGQFVEIEGVTAPGGFAPILMEKNVRVLGKAPLPVAHQVSFDQLDAGVEDCKFVELSGVVRSAQPSGFHFDLMIAVGGGRVRAAVYEFPEADVPRLVDSTVRFRGVVGSTFNQKRQLLGPMLFVTGATNVVVEQATIENPFEIPAQPVSGLRQYMPSKSFAHRVKVRGIVTHHDPRRALFIQDQTQGLYAQTTENIPIEPGDIVEVLGFPAMSKYMPFLENATYRVVGKGAEPSPIITTPKEILEGKHGSELITVQAHLVDVVRRETELVLLLQSQQTIFDAHLNQVRNGELRVPFAKGSEVKLTGICAVEEISEVAPSKFLPQSFRLLLRSLNDVVMIKRPSWWTPQRLLWALGVMVLIILASLIWIQLLRRKVREQTTIIRETVGREAVLGERNRIAREFHDTLEQELAGITIQLDTVAADLKESRDLAAESLQLARQMARRSLTEARQSVLNLRCHALEIADLPTALSEITRSTNADKSVHIAVNVRGSAQRLPAVFEHNLLRIGQEAVTNAINHGHATQIRVEFTYGSDFLRMRIEDDGRGFDPKLVASMNGGHFGLQGMRERVEQMEGDFKLCSSRETGTFIEIEVRVPAVTKPVASFYQ